MALTDREIDAIERYVEPFEVEIEDSAGYRWDKTHSFPLSADQARLLIADLRALRAAVRAIPEPTAQGTGDMAGYLVCLECRATVPWAEWGTLTHAPDCPWAVARALAGEEVSG